jgi:hypothetical protein
MNDSILDHCVLARDLHIIDGIRPISKDCNVHVFPGAAGQATIRQSCCRGESIEEDIALQGICVQGLPLQGCIGWDEDCDARGVGYGSKYACLAEGGGERSAVCR